MAVKTIVELGQQAKIAAARLALLSVKEKNQALDAIAEGLRKNTAMIIEENQKDITAAEQNGISGVMTDRLRLDQARVSAIADAAEKVISLEDPVGQITGGRRLENGLEIIKKRVPLGVAGIIYESRPNVTVDAAVLCLKSSNAVILRGGTEAIHSNKALARVMREALASCQIDENCVSLVEDTSRETSVKMMRLNQYLDVLIPRGGAGLIQAVTQQATVPVIETGTGNCHVYVDSEADLEMAVSIIHNAKTSRPSVCNACESIVVHRKIAKQFLPLMASAFSSHQVVMAGCKETKAILGDQVLEATAEDYQKEYLDYKVSVKVVGSVEEAIAHINQYTTHHSECIVTRNLDNSNKFTQQVDAAAVYVNASTRFTDGEEFGLGAEIGISTQKLHARGPMGLEALTTIKYVVNGNGQIR